MISILFLVVVMGLALYAFIDGIDPEGSAYAARKRARRRELRRSAERHEKARQVRRAARRHGGAR